MAEVPGELQYSMVLLSLWDGSKMDRIGWMGVVCLFF